MIVDEVLEEYAKLLESHGFTVYEPRRYFRYSRIVNGLECFGYVQRRWTGSDYEHTMPIRPTIQNGSSMWVDLVPDTLTVETALAVARPSNQNPIVGRQVNYDDPRWADLYVKRGPA